MEPPQELVLGPMLISFSINDLFLGNIGSVICNLADDNTIAGENDLLEITLDLQNDLRKLPQRFSCNGMVVNF